MAVTINFTFKDAKNKSRITKVRVPTGFSPSQYMEFAIAMGQILANLSDGSITEISVGIPLDLSAATIKGVAVGAADVAKKVFFGALSSVSGLFAKFIMPTFDESYTVSGTDDVDVADPDIAAVIALVESGGTFGGFAVRVKDKYDNNLDDVNIAREQFRRFN